MPNDGKSLLLDLDGTLVDSASDLAIALNSVLQQHKRPTVTLNAVRCMIGDGIGALVERGFAVSGQPTSGAILSEAIEQCQKFYALHSSDTTRLYPQVAETLTLLRSRGYAMAVCTNKPEGIACEILRALGVQAAIELVVGGDTLASRKPDPAPLLAAIDKLGAPPGSAVMVGDGHHDVLAARAAGVPVVFVSYGYGSAPAEPHAPDRIIDAFGRLPQALIGLGPR